MDMRTRGLGLAGVLCGVLACGGADPSDGLVVDATQGKGEADTEPAQSSGIEPTSADPETSTSAADPSSSSSGDEGATDDDATDTADEDAVDPRMPGPHATTGAMHQIVVGSDTVQLTLVRPQGDGPFPTVIFSHGFQLGPSNYASYAEHLASWGYVTVMPQYPGSLFDPRTHVELMNILVAILDWVEADGADPRGPLGGVANADEIALVGHSLGGKLSLLTAAHDPRPAWIVGIDPVDAAGGPGQLPNADHPSVTPELMPQISARLALLGETTNAEGTFGQACAPADENFHQYFVHAQSPAIEIEFLHANHMSFLDDPNCGLACVACPAGTDDPTLTRRMTHGILVAFLQGYLRGDAAYHPWLLGAPMQADVDAGHVTVATANGF
jgi:pimeloyl-ACP methyl ester carboxylesterase